MRIKHQLFLSLLGANALVILLMFALSTWSFNRGFLNYINQIESRRLAPVIESLEQEYIRQQNWDRLASDRHQWRNLLAEFRPPPRSSRKSLKGAAGFPVPDKEEPDEKTPGNKRPAGNETHPPNRGGDVSLVDPRLLLADKSKNILIGNKENSTQIQWSKISVADEVVGFLGFRPMQRISEDFDQIFARQQQRGLLLAAVLMTLVSTLVSVLLSSRLVKPILAIDKTLSKISEGNYEHRLELSRNDELGDLAKNVNLLGRTLEQNLSARQQWIAEISHELRTPIAVLQGEIEALQDGVRSLDAQALSSLHAETLRLSRLVNDLHDLNLSDLGALSYSMQPLDVCELIHTCMASYSIECREKELLVALHNTAENTMVNGDHQRLAQLFHNLMQNSVRYTTQCGSITISTATEEQNLIINWSDTAPGVSDAHLPRIFDVLYRTEESRNREFGGSGLGLAIVEKIVLAHQGSVVATHSAEGGLCIIITLPQAHT